MGLYSIHYGSGKVHLLLFWFLQILLIVSIVLIETAYTAELSYLFIIIFRILSLIAIIALFPIMMSNRAIQPKQSFFCLTLLITHISIFVLSFYFHYTTIFLSAIPPIITWFSFKPSKLDILIGKKAPEILNKLKEAILIVSMKGKVLLLNRAMSELIDFPDHPIPLLQQVSSVLTGKEHTIHNWMKGKSEPDDIYLLNDKHFLINTSLIPGKGLIITVSEITEKVLVQRKLEQSIIDLESLTEKLQNYSINTETVAVRRERTMIYRHIQEIIKNGLVGLNSDLIKIRFEPPENYEYVLKRSRSMLNEIREIVTNWRTITGANH